MMLVNLAKANNINKLASYGDKLDNDGNKFHKEVCFKMWECVFKMKKSLGLDDYNWVNLYQIVCILPSNQQNFGLLQDKTCPF